MNKIVRFSVPFFIACLLLGMLIWWVGASSQAIASENYILNSSVGKQFNKSEDEPQNNLLVTTLQDELNSDGDCSLREAIQAANTNIQVDACASGDALTDTVTFSVQGTILLASQLSVAPGGPIIIDGGGVITISGGDATRVLSIDSGSQLTLRYLTMTNGFVDQGNGAGIYNLGELRIISSEISANHCLNLGSGIYNNGTITLTMSTVTSNGSHFGASEGGGIYNLSSLTIMSSTISSNYIGFQSAGISNSGILTITNTMFVANMGGGMGGGAISNSGQLNIYKSSFFGNNTSANGGAINNHGPANISNSMFSGNTGFEGGAIYNLSPLHIMNSTFLGNQGFMAGGGIRNANLLTITNSTFTLNSSSEFGGGINNTGSLTITNSTLAMNSSLEGGGIYGFAIGNAVLINTVAANNYSGGDCGGEIVDGGHNLDSDYSCSLIPGNDSLPGVNPVIDQLKDNGGPTPTHALLEGSPAIDAGDDALCPETDQRGFPRPIDGDRDGIAVCDIGSYELEEKLIFNVFLPVTIK